MESAVKKYALIAAIESNDVSIDSKQGIKRFFEKEALMCFTHWRNNAGILSDIDIYCICPTRNGVSKNTREKFNELKVNYIEQYFPETEDFDCGFWNKPLIGKYFESKFAEKYDVIIHVDLDMYLLSPLDESSLIENSCLVYDSTQRLKERVFKDQVHAFNTCFIVTKASDLIFTEWYETLRNLPKFPDDFYHQFERLEKRKIEELAFDLLSLKKTISPIEDLMFGETYTDLGQWNLESLRKIRFHHYHIYDNYSQYKWLENIKRLNEIKKSF